MFFPRRPPDYRGYVDSAQGGRITGWAWNRSRPRQRLDVEIYAAGTLLGSARADLFRDDLLRSKIGDGRYGFAFTTGSDVAPETVAAKVTDGDCEFWLLDGGRAELEASTAGLMNSARRGLPLLRPALSQRSADDSDLAIAAELQQIWRSGAVADGHAAATHHSTMWDYIVSTRHGRLADLLQSDNPRALAAHLVALQTLPEAEGLAQGERAYRDFVAATPEGRRAAIASYHDMLASLAQYLGVKRAECAALGYEGATLAVDQDRLAAGIETALGHGIAPPTVFDGLYGLAFGDRVLHDRDIQALYAALRAIEASGKAQPVICEIGGGFGQAAHYAWLRGVRRYTIVDLPTVCAMQYFYLRKTLPGVRVRFRDPADDPDGTDGIDLTVASKIDASARLRGDIVLNCDSFPEMGDEICGRYFGLIPRWAPLLLSINQEANIASPELGGRQAVVGELLPQYGFTRRYRFRSWIRRGFVEELWSAPQPNAGA
jgi:hypothetical protein